ncbi:MAG: Cna B-type domain-containing protein [Oscillospiraceae bacterium]|nr:Cna B-type domain-containing protein [Oscillospiraceae bacterium]
MKKIYRKLSWVLLVAMLFSMLATGTVFAEDNELPAEPTVTEAPADQETPEDAPVQSPVASAEPADTDPAPEEEPVVESTPVAETEPEPLGDTMEYDKAATVNHIDIAVALKATITVNGTTETKTLKLTTADANNVSITASSGTFTRSGVSTSTDSSGHAQIRIKGTFPVGTKTNPINYTVSYSTSILVAGVSVPVTFALTTNYWSSDNVCPGLDRNWQNGSVAGGSGIDLALGTGTGSVATSGSMTIQKTVSGAALTADKTFVFDIYSGEKLYKTVSVTVKAGQTTAAALLTAVPFGTYTVREQTESAELDGYKVTVSGSDTVTLSSSNLSGAANIVNTYEEIPKYNKVVYSVSKGWNDADNNDGMRPASLEVYLLAGGEVVDTVTLSAANGWKADFAEQSVPIQNPPVYTVAEAVVPAGYTAGKPVLNGTEFTITNTHKLETTSITVVKKWDDGDNNDRSRPDSITVNLLADGEKVRTAEITAEDDWKVTFENLPFYKDGKKIVYTVTEEPVPGYTAKVDDYVITNSYTLKTVAYSVTKAWDDADNNDGKRPQSVTVNLLADGEPVDTVVLSEENNWTAQFAPQKVYKDGVTVAYTVEEAKVPAGYTSTTNMTDGVFTVTNTHKLETRELTVTKKWDDQNNNDGIRPETIEVQLFADGVKVGEAVTMTDTYTFKDLPVYKNGKAIKYTVQEVNVAGGYSATYEYKDGNATILNTHKLETTSITVIKKWDDGDNNDRSRPDSITVNLLADGEKVRSAEITAEDDWKVTFENLPFYKDGKKIVYTVTEEPVPGYTATIDDDDYVIINSYILKTVAYSVTKVWDDADNNDGKRPQSVTVNLLADGEPVDTVVLSEDNNWTAQFAPQKVYKDGVTVAYTVEEAEVPAGYTSATNLTDGGFTVTNTHKPETTEIQVKKVWADDNDNDGIRPDSVQIQLYADGEKVGEAVTMTDSYTFKDLPVYKAGEKIAYEVREENVAEGYTASYAEEDGVYVITNTHKSETRELTVTKKWDDQDDNDGIRPESVQIQLYADGVKLGDAVTMTDTYTFKDLPVSKDGKEIEYTVQEVNVASGYTASYEYKDGNVIITNTHKLETTTVTVTKTWVDNNNAKKARPDSITVQLYANGEKYGDAVAITKGMSWKYTFKDLPKYKDGKAVTYTVKETGVKHYVAKYSTKNDTITITNTYTDIPLTGDTINLLMWMLIVLAAGGALAGIGIFGHRKKSFGK